MVQLDATNNVILPSWMPFISKMALPVLATNECMEKIDPNEKGNSDNLFTIQNFLNCLTFSDQLMLNYLKDQLKNYKTQENLKSKISENFWNWTCHLCWIIRSRYIKEFDIEAMNNFENEAKENHNIIYLSPPELDALSKYTKCIERLNGEYEYEYDILLDTLNLHQSLCLELLNIENGMNIDNKKKVFFLWWFMSYNLLKIFNKSLLIYESREMDKIIESGILNEKYSFNSINITFTTHSNYNYFTHDLLSFAKYYLDAHENNTLLVFFENDDDYENQKDLFCMLENAKLKCQPVTFTHFENEMKNSGLNKERDVYESIRASKDIRDFTVTKQLGKGSSGFVRNAVHSKTQKKVIIKYVVKSLILRGCWTNSNDNYKRFPNEIAVLESLYNTFNGDVPNNLTKLISYWEDSIYYYLVFADTADFDSDLFDYIDKSTDKMMPEDEAKIIFKNIAETIQILHHNNIVHRDIKDENVLINYKTKDIQLIDFGSSSFYKKDQKLSNFVGSFLFAAPEIIKGMTYEGPQQDIWSLGILLYTMIYKATPFNDYYEIIRKKIIFPQTISNDCKELILWMTNRDINKRPTIDQV